MHFTHKVLFGVAVSLPPARPVTLSGDLLAAPCTLFDGALLPQVRDVPVLIRGLEFVGPYPVVTRGECTLVVAKPDALFTWSGKKRLK